VTDSYVNLDDIPVLRLKADMAGKGPAAAFEQLESRLQTLKGRRFYGTFRETPQGEEYFACVTRVDSDDPEVLRLEVGTIPGGWYVRRKLLDWDSKLAELPRLFKELAHSQDVDPIRPSLEFYRSQKELHLLVPVRSTQAAQGRSGQGKSEAYDARSSIMDDEGRAHPG
jgi:hypothetical protein